MSARRGALTRAGVRLAGRAARAGAWVGLGRSALDPDRLLRRARRRARVQDAAADDLAEAPVVEALPVLARALEAEARLTPLGRLVAGGMVTRALENRLRIRDLVLANPEIAAERIDRPLFVAGFPRTGTTLLQNLLAADPEARPLLGWEAYHPLPRRGLFGDPRPRKHARDVRMLLDVVPELPSVHAVTAAGPEECLPLLLRTFVSPAWHLYAYVPSYRQWLDGQPPSRFVDAYRFHADQLRVLQWSRPGGRWLLKSPAHLQSVPALLEAYPDAIVVRTHRDTRKVLPSTCSLVRLLRHLVGARVDDLELGRQALRLGRRVLDAMEKPIEARDRQRVVEVLYADLVARPIEVVERVQAAAGRDVSAAMRVRMERWLAENPRHRHGVHRYALSDFGLAEDEVEGLSARYHARFGVPSES